jgi:MFS family permease
MTVYIRESLVIAVMTVTVLLTIRSVAGMASTSVAGVILDRFGRKTALVCSMGGYGLVFVSMAFTHHLALWVLLMASQGVFNAMQVVGQRAMVADLIQPERRSDAYALLRVMKNTGVALGPSIGSVLVAISYTLAFLSAAMLMLVAAAIVIWLIPETLTREDYFDDETPIKAQKEFGYGRILRDYRFLIYCGVFSLIPMVYIMPMTLMPVYMKEQYGLAESNFGIMMTVNASMIVLCEFWLTRSVKRFQLERVLAVGASFYATSMVIMAVAASFEAFMLVMVVLTIGEMLVMPNAITYTSNLAPPDMRGRYMSVHQFAWSAGAAIGPLIAGLLNDGISPQATWFGGAVLGALAMLGFVLIGVSGRKAKRKHAQAVNAAP